MKELTKGIHHILRLSWNLLLWRPKGENVLEAAAIVKVTAKCRLRWRQSIRTRKWNGVHIILNICTGIIDDPLHPWIHWEPHNEAGEKIRLRGAALEREAFQRWTYMREVYESDNH